MSTSAPSALILERRLRSLTILNDAGYITRFHPNPGQLKLLAEIERQFRERERVRIIILKARQIGFSTAIEALYYTLSFMFPNYYGIVMAHSKRTAGNIFDMTKRYWDYDPFRPVFTLGSNSKSELSVVETGSRLEVATAGNPEAGRGATFRFVHASEAAFYPFPEETIKALRAAVHPRPGTVVALESTAKGVGNPFHVEWERAEAGDSDYVPFFYAWWEHPAYRATRINEPIAKPPYTEDERVLMNVYGLDADQIGWRRWKLTRDLSGDLLAFHQEYPSNPEEAFVSTGNNVFPLDVLKAAYRPRNDSVRGTLA